MTTEPPLSLVREPDIDGTPLEMPDKLPVEIPAFEGQPVHATKAKITSVNNLEIDDRHFKVDESVKLIVEVRVSNVSHQVDEKTGELHRVHTFKATDAIVIGWDIDMDALGEALSQ